MTKQNIRSAENRLKQRTRMINYFVKAASEIAKNDGFDKVTLRKTTDYAGYNSATLYNYFKNLDHLLLYVAMPYINNYIENLAKSLKKSKGAKETYMMMWKCLYKHSCEFPDMFYQFFFAIPHNKSNEYVNEYYKIFPINIDEYEPDIKKIIFEVDIEYRDLHVLNKSISMQQISEKSADDLSKILILLYEALLFRIKRKTISKEEAYKHGIKYVEILVSKFFTKC